MGLAIPFLLAAFFLANATNTLRRINRHAHAIEMVSAVFLIGIGILLVSDQFSTLNTYFNTLAPEWMLQYL
jgi:threonine/homoserine/homoserine lactone efflux protein